MQQGGALLTPSLHQNKVLNSMVISYSRQIHHLALWIALGLDGAMAFIFIVICIGLCLFVLHFCVCVCRLKSFTNTITCGHAEETSHPKQTIVFAQLADPEENIVNKGSWRAWDIGE